MEHGLIMDMCAAQDTAMPRTNQASFIWMLTYKHLKYKLPRSRFVGTKQLLIFRK